MLGHQNADGRSGAAVGSFCILHNPYYRTWNLSSYLSVATIATDPTATSGRPTHTHRNSVVCFPNVGQRVDAVSKGDLVHVTGRIRENDHGEGNNITCRTGLIAGGFSILSWADSLTSEHAA